MNFKFNLSNQNIEAKSVFKKTLKPWEIHEVHLTGVDLNSYDDKDTGEKKFIINFNFEGIKESDANDVSVGVFSAGLFPPSEPADGERRTSQSGNQLPSKAEQFMYQLAHVGQTIAPKNFAKFESREFNLPDDIETMVEMLKQVFASAIQKKETFKLKLISSNNGNTSLPWCVNISKKTGEAFFSNDWLGDKVFWSDYELRQMKEKKSEGPTSMPADKLPGGIDIDNDTKGSLLDDLDSLDDMPFNI